MFLFKVGVLFHIETRTLSNLKFNVTLASKHILDAQSIPKDDTLTECKRY